MAHRVLDLMIRVAKPEDLPWVRTSWLTSYADSDTALLSTPRDSEHAVRCEHCNGWSVRRAGDVARAGEEYWRGQKWLIAELLNRAHTLVSEADDGLLDGFMTYDGDRFLVHYIYVRLSARKRGVARSLVAALGQWEGVTYTHRSRTLKASRLPKHFRFDPYALYLSLAQ